MYSRPEASTRTRTSPRPAAGPVVPGKPLELGAIVTAVVELAQITGQTPTAALASLWLAVHAGLVRPPSRGGELLGRLSRQPERLLGLFRGLDLAAWKLPQAAMLLVRGALLEKYAPVGIDEQAPIGERAVHVEAHQLDARGAFADVGGEIVEVRIHVVASVRPRVRAAGSG